jgi:hypothetical protein
VLVFQALQIILKLGARTAVPQSSALYIGGTVGIFGFSKSTGTSSCGPRFVFANGTSHSPEEYGYLALQVGFQSAMTLVTEWFAKGSSGESLGLAKAVQEVRFPADVYTTMLEVGAYLWHAASSPEVDGAVIARVVKGVADGLAEVRMPSGQPLDAQTKESLLQHAKRFAAAIEQDVNKSTAAGEGTYRAAPLPSTALLLDMLRRSHSKDAAVIEQWKAELNSVTGVWLWNSIEASTLATMSSLARDLKVRFQA